MGITRRQVLAGGIAAVGTAAVVRNPFASLLDHSTPATSSTDHPVLVLVTLYGGNDGLNTVIPAAAGAYLSGRGDLAVPADQVLTIGDGLGLHPNLKAMKRLWDAGQVAIVRGVGHPNPNRSHFRSMDIWQSGVPERAVATGWLGRWLDRTGTDPLRAIAIGPTVPLALRGEKVAASAVPVGSVALPVSAPVADAYRAMMGVGSSGLAGSVARTGTDLLTVERALGRIVDGAGASEDEGSATNLEGRAQGALGPQLDLVARAIAAGLPTRVYAVSLGGFDTHANEKDAHAQLLADLDGAVDAFTKAVGGRPVTVLVHSEFGRRVAVNGSGGTDHGAAAPVFVIGPRVRGGFHGDEPSLTDLDDGDLKHTTDYRSIYASVLGNVVGVDPSVALAKAPTALPLFRS